MSHRIGADIGGTFTDLVLVDDAGALFRIAKVLTTPERPDQAVERAVAMGAKVLIPAQNQFWGDRTARILDPSGHVWTVASRVEETSEEQRAARWSEFRERGQSD